MVQRGCGEREEHGLYLCVETSPFGMPLEHFLVDPVLEWKGGQVRAPMLVPDQHGINHIMMGIGEQYYPTVPSFVEEAKVLGVSKRVPNDFDLSPLTPGKSKFLLMHPKAIPRFPYVIMDLKCPKEVCNCNWHCRPVIESKHECIGALWPLSAFVNIKGHETSEVKVAGGKVKQTREKTTMEKIREEFCNVRIRIPSTEYVVSLPEEPKTGERLKYSSGIIFMFPRFHFEYVSRRKKIPPELKKRFEVSEWILEVCEE